MNTFGQRLKRARIEKKLTQEQLASLIGAKGAAVSTWEVDRNYPDIAAICRICGALDITPTYLLQGEDDNEHRLLLARPEQNHIKKYRSVDDHGRRVIDMATEYEYRRCVPEYEIDEKAFAFPVGYESAAAGWGNYLTEGGFNYISINPIKLHPKAKFGIRISGNSMEPQYQDGDIVQVEPCPAIQDGELGVFNLDGDAVFKRLVIDHDKKRIALRSLNPEYADRIIGHWQNLHTYGRVVGKLDQ